jgi:hypothetical protein
MTRKKPQTPNTAFASGGLKGKLGALCFYSSSVHIDNLRLSGICNAALYFVEFVIRHKTLCFVSQVYFLDNCKLSSVLSGIANAAQRVGIANALRLSGICNAALNIVEFVIQQNTSYFCHHANRIQHKRSVCGILSDISDSLLD